MSRSGLVHCQRAALLAIAVAGACIGPDAALHLAHLGGDHAAACHESAEHVESAEDCSVCELGTSARLALVGFSPGTQLAPPDSAGALATPPSRPATARFRAPGAPRAPPQAA